MADRVIRLEMLGGLSVRVGGRVLEEFQSSRTRAALFVYLAVEGEASRDTVKSIFWPESSSSNARHALRQGLYQLRQMLGKDWLEASRTQLRVNSNVTTDVRAFEGAVSRGDHDAAARLYAGPFLFGLHLADVQSWDGWVEARRLQLARTFRQSCRAWVDACLADEDLEAALNAARAWVTPDPLDDEAQHRLLDLLVRAGDRTGAMRQFETYQRLLAADGLTPLEETRALYESMLASSEPVEPGSTMASPPAPRTEPAHLVTPPVAAPASPPARRRATGKNVFVAAAAIVFIAVGLIGGWNRLASSRGGTADVTERAWTIVADVDGNAAEDIRHVARGLASAAIDESVVLKVLPADQIRRGLLLAGKPAASTWLTVQTAREVAFRGSVRTVVAPTIDQVGRTYAVTVRVVDAESGAVIAVARGTAEGEDELVGTLDEVIKQIRVHLGERLQEIRTTRPLRQVTTPSYAAYRLYDRGVTRFSDGDFVGAIAAHRDALGHDPDFVAAMFQIAAAYSNLGITDSARVYLQHIAARPERLNEIGRLTVDAYIAGANPATLLSLDERIYRETRSNHGPYAYRLVGVGRYEEAVAVAQQGDAESPFGLSQIQLSNLAYWLLPLGRFDEARMYADRLEGSLALWMQAQIAHAETRWPLADTLVTTLLQRPDDPQRFARIAPVLLASTRAARGRVREANEILDRRMRLAAQQEDAQAYENFRTARLILAVSSGAVLTPGVAGADDVPSAAPPLPPSLSSPSLARLTALWATWTGDTVSAVRYLAANNQPDALADAIDVDGAYRLLLQARVAAAAGNWDRVIQLLAPVGEPATARRMGPPLNQLARWTIAEACEQKNDLTCAATWYHRIASYEGFSDNDQKFRGLVHSFAHRRLASIYGRLSDSNKAATHWRFFLDSFTEPEPELQWMVDEARTELARSGSASRPARLPQ